ncbi:hypothetical protein RUM43_007460, partial [Polyplax serrata]
MPVRDLNPVLVIPHGQKTRSPKLEAAKRKILPSVQFEQENEVSTEGVANTPRNPDGSLTKTSEVKLKATKQ